MLRAGIPGIQIALWEDVDDTPITNLKSRKEKAMTINGISRMTELDMMRSIYAAAYSPSTNTNCSSTSSVSGAEQLQISSAGNFMNAVSQMSSSDQASIKSFMDDLVSSVKDGTFDASTVASSAPSALSSYAEASGIDLTQLVQDLANGAGHGGPGVYGPPPPLTTGDMSMASSVSDAASASGASSLDLSSLENLSSSDKTDLQSFLKELTTSIKDGTFDASSMASSAPDALKSLAEENGIDLAQLTQDLADGIEKGKNGPPPPPPMMADMFNTSGTSSASSSDTSSLESLSSNDKAALESLLTTLVQEMGNTSTSASDTSSTSSLDLSSLQSLSSNDKSSLEAFFTALLKELGNGTTSGNSSDSTSSVASA
jgi:hypothetical protein